LNVKVANTILVVAGEASGDLHGAELLRELKARQPDLRVVGIGGEKMSPYVDRKLADVRDLGVVGFVEVIKHLPAIWRLKHEVLRVAAEEKISLALLIDYPGFNLSLAKSLRASMPKVRLHQYVCPQVWAWKKGRIPSMGKLLDTLYCLFDFEPKLFNAYPVEAIWVGHPLVEVVKPEVDRATFFQEQMFDPARPLVALLPGSRKGEIEKLLPSMVALVNRWKERHADVQWAIPVAPTLDESFLRTFLGEASIRLIHQRTYATRAFANAAIVASGTATLETALLGTPFFIVYKLNGLTYQVARRVVKLPYFGLANVVAGKCVAKELVQGQVNREALDQELQRLLDPTVAANARKDLLEVRSHLGEPGAAGRVAEHLLSKFSNGGAR
jgi:lipid-A-disaccharide synthase